MKTELTRYGQTYRIVSMGLAEPFDIRPLPDGQFVLFSDVEAYIVALKERIDALEAAMNPQDVSAVDAALRVRA